MLHFKEGVEGLKQRNSACELLIKLFIDTVLTSELPAAVSHASFSLIYPASIHFQ
jgi:hypothetical protein